MAKANTTTVHRLPLTEARHHLGAVVKRVHLNKEYVLLEKDGIPVVGIMDADELEDYLELKDAKVRAHIRKSHQDYLAGKSRPAEELLAELTKSAQKDDQRGKSRPMDEYLAEVAARKDKEIKRRAKV